MGNRVVLVGQEKKRGRGKNEMIRRGREIHTGGCEAQEVTIGDFPFISLDFGDTIRASQESGQYALNVENTESNQCVLMHLVAGVQRGISKKQQGIPDKSRVTTEAKEWRSDEIKQAKLALEWCRRRWRFHSARTHKPIT